MNVAAAAALLTPVATPANMMVMEPGGYRFGDYWKLGLPLHGLVRRRRHRRGPPHLALLTPVRPQPPTATRCYVPPLGGADGCRETAMPRAVLVADDFDPIPSVARTRRSPSRSAAVGTGADHRGRRCPWPRRVTRRSPSGSTKDGPRVGRLHRRPWARRCPCRRRRPDPGRGRASGRSPAITLARIRDAAAAFASATANHAELAVLLDPAPDGRDGPGHRRGHPPRPLPLRPAEVRCEGPAGRAHHPRRHTRRREAVGRRGRAGPRPSPWPVACPGTWPTGRRRT